MTKTFELRVITEISGPNEEACEEALGALQQLIEEEICGTVEVVNEEIQQHAK